MTDLLLLDARRQLQPLLSTRRCEHSCHFTDAALQDERSLREAGFPDGHSLPPISFSAVEVSIGRAARAMKMGAGDKGASKADGASPHAGVRRAPRRPFRLVWMV